ncbi:MAG: sugar phosphorylase [Anaerolinea sp.]|nr:sugar phosphorylase [Anaerolinea sp.]
MGSLNSAISARLADLLIRLYGHADALSTIEQMIAARPIQPRQGSDDRELPLIIAYADHIRSSGEWPLLTLGRFAREYLAGLIGGLHLLPFYPYTSDDGFSVVDYRTVDPMLGSWADIASLSADFRLMFDLVLNHASVSSSWFQRFLADEPPYNNYFVTADPALDLSAVVRPRTHPLLTPFETAAGTRYVWTTFSADQVDLNYGEPALLLEMLDILLDYVRRGADYIRLDAIAFLWKIPGTPCIHLPQTHAVVQLMRAVLDAAAPWVKLVTETNVPHHENLTYFGDGYNEAQMVYQFALPPLLLHTFLTGSAEMFTDWAASLSTPSDRATFFNFTASHDGIGIRPVTDLLPSDALDYLFKTVTERGGQISYRVREDGSRSPYELNITYFDALRIPSEPLSTSIDRFITSQAIQLALAGLPGIYLSSLFGAESWHEGAAQTGRARTLNREKFDFERLAAMLTSNSHHGLVFRRYQALLHARAACPAFSVTVPQQMLHLHRAVVAIERDTVLALHNVSGEAVDVTLPDGHNRRDLLSGTNYDSSRLRLAPYGVLWLERYPG